MLKKEIMEKCHIRQSLSVIFSYETYHMNTDQKYESFPPSNETLFIILILVSG
jgi:hypothetical protein